MSLKAKVKCVSVTGTGTPRTSEIVHLEAISTPDPKGENFSFSTIVPPHAVAVLAANMTITNPKALGTFKQGESYLLSFSPAPKSSKKR